MAADIEYKSIHNFKCSDLERLFLSVEWSSGHYPEKLVLAMQNFNTVYSAWDGGKLVGLICVMDDGVMDAYIHYLLVDSDYQDRTIGSHLLQLVKEKYKTFMKLAVIGYNKEINFYENAGFVKSENCSALFLTIL
ncbi:GNAT family N-acetyltransferase [Streptococcus equinus]|uniref:GNAT family N-acetyltransferase n=1 Tax=Streptococcus equinus TaxID=1335 RepID=UPI003BF8518B